MSPIDVNDTQIPAVRLCYGKYKPKCRAFAVGCQPGSKGSLVRDQHPAPGEVRYPRVGYSRIFPVLLFMGAASGIKRAESS
jgi:hypothetical protein